VGKGERRDALVDLVARLGLQRQVLFAGYRDADLPAVVASLDVFVLLGAGSDESCRAALEAMAAGRPVVAARVGALPDAVVHEETGLLVDSNPGDVAAAIERLLADANGRRAMGDAGRRRATDLFAPERHAAVMEALYLEALARRARRS
jgi:glycosyltransferase involved in cell wall biosynthesis